MIDLRQTTSAGLEYIATWIRSKRDAELWAYWRGASQLTEVNCIAIDFSEENAFSLFREQELLAGTRRSHGRSQESNRQNLPDRLC